MKKIKVLTVATALPTLAAATLIPLASCNKGDTSPVKPGEGGKEKETTDGTATYSLTFDKKPDGGKATVSISNTSGSKVQFITGTNDTTSTTVTVGDDLKANVKVGFVETPTTDVKATFSLKFTYQIDGKSQTAEISNCTLKCNVIHVTSVSLNKTTMNLLVGSSETLTATVTPSDATNKEVTLTSSDTSIAKVDENTGVVTGVANGTATITATTKDGSKTATCTVNVTQPIIRTLTSIEVTTVPSKVSYVEGQYLNLADMVVTATFDDGESTEVVTSSCTTNPNTSTPLTTDTTSVTVSYTEGGITKTDTFDITVVAKVVESIAVTTQPDKTTYTAGEYLDLTGMVVTATYNDESEQAVTGYTTNPSTSTPLTTDTTSVTVSYTEDEITKTTTFSITVNPQTTSVTVSGTHNVDINDSSTLTFVAKDQTESVITSSCTWTISPTDLGSFDTAGTLTLSAKAQAQGGSATITATPTAGIAGTFDIEIGSFNYLDAGELANGKAKGNSDKSWTGKNVILPSRWFNASNNPVSITSLGSFNETDTTITKLYVSKNISSVVADWANLVQIDDIVVDQANTTFTSTNLAGTTEYHCIMNKLSGQEPVALYRGCRGTTLPTSVNRIKGDAFKFVKFASGAPIFNFNNIEYIETQAFYSSNITNVTLVKTIEIGTNAFMYCSSLTNVTIPDTVTTIGSNAFNCCALLYDDPAHGITFNDTSKMWSFSDPTNGNIIWSPSATNIQENGKVLAQTHLNYDKAVSNMKFAFTTEDAGHTASVKAGINFGDETLIVDDYYLVTPTSGTAIQYTVTSIEAAGFANKTTITTAKIGSHITSIGNGAFTGCSALSTLYIDSQDIVNLATDDSGLFTNATTIYIEKDTLTDPTSGYIYTWFTKQDYSEVEGYNKWTKNNP